MEVPPSPGGSGTARAELALRSLPEPLLADTCAFLWSLLDASHLGVVLCDREARLVGGNRPLLRLAALEPGVPAERWQRRFDLRDHAGEPYADVASIPLVRALAEDVARNVVMQQGSPRGPALLHGTTRPLRDAEGQLLGAAGVFALPRGGAGHPPVPSPVDDRPVGPTFAPLLLATVRSLQRPAPGQDAVVARVDDVLRRRYAEPLDLGAIAASVGYSPTYLTHHVKTATGRSVMQRLEDVRLDVARELLRSTDLSVTAVAGRSGPWEPTQFTRVFRRVHGVAPSAWRAGSTT